MLLSGSIFPMDAITQALQLPENRLSICPIRVPCLGQVLLLIDEGWTRASDGHSENLGGHHLSKKRDKLCPLTPTGATQ